MALIKTDEARELQDLQKVETLIKRRQRRERCPHIIIGALGVLLVASVITGHCCGRHKGRR